MATPEKLHEAAVRIGRSNPQGRRGASKYLKRVDYSVLQQCIHCAMCTYHEACHLCHGQKITRQPRQVLTAIPGLKLVELPESTWCCLTALDFYYDVITLLSVYYE